MKRHVGGIPLFSVPGCSEGASLVTSSCPPLPSLSLDVMITDSDMSVCNQFGNYGTRMYMLYLQGCETGVLQILPELLYGSLLFCFRWAASIRHLM